MYGYPYLMELTLTGNCDVFYSAGGFLDLERV
jgi:hypothetical protein